MSVPDVAVVGGGVIGLATAWRCAQRGLRVSVVDPEPGSGASTVAAGMLAPVTEAHFGEEPLLRLALASSERWPAFAAEVAAELAPGTAQTPMPSAPDLTNASVSTALGYRTDGTVLVGRTEDDLREIQRMHRFYHSLGLPAEAMSGRECRALVPLLTPRIRGGMHAAGDHQVDPRRLTAGLLAAAGHAGVRFDRRRVGQLDELRAGRVVLAAGCWSAQLLDLAVRPVKGQIVRLRAPGDGRPGFRHIVRAIAGSRSIYLVPRPEGEVVVGATVEELGHDVTVTAAGVHDLLRAAIDVLPEIAEYELVEARAGLRPGTPDNAPLLGPTANPRVVAATGHYRHGILLTPVTADAIAELVATGATSDLIAPFDPRRFHSDSRLTGPGTRTAEEA